MAKKHEVIIVGMGLASLAAAARLNELGVKDIGIYSVNLEQWTPEAMYIAE